MRIRFIETHRGRYAKGLVLDADPVFGQAMIDQKYAVSLDLETASLSGGPERAVRRRGRPRKARPV